MKEDPMAISREMNDQLHEVAAHRNVDVANALKINRPTLGDNCGVALYRLLRLVALEDIIGRGAAGTAYVAGKKLGLSLGMTKLEDFLALCSSLKIGIIEVPVLTPEKVHVDVYECITCSGMDRVGRPLCHFEGGLVAGAVETILKKRTRAIEVTCIGGLGDKACGFDLQFK
jgi:predicted hydrocarbon binding protein